MFLKPNTINTLGFQNRLRIGLSIKNDDTQISVLTHFDESGYMNERILFIQRFKAMYLCDKYYKLKWQWQILKK